MNPIYSIITYSDDNSHFIRELILISYLLSSSSLFIFIQTIISIKLDNLDLKEGYFFLGFIIAIIILLFYTILQYYITKRILFSLVKESYIPYLFREDNHLDIEWTEYYLSVFIIIPTLIADFLFICNYSLVIIIIVVITIVIIEIGISFCLPHKLTITKKILCLV